jgi:hypothetical protein
VRRIPALALDRYTSAGLEHAGSNDVSTKSRRVQPGPRPVGPEGDENQAATAPVAAFQATLAAGVRTRDLGDATSTGEFTQAVPIPGPTVAERRARASEDPAVQGLRAVLCSEPRGHADMYGGFIVPPDDDAADLGVLFWHKDGFSTACGHGTIALGAWAVETSRVAAPETGSVDVMIDVPSGRVTARLPLQVDANSAKMLREMISGAGALICGRRLFDLTNGWDDNHPIGAPVVVTHNAPQDTAKWPP